MIRAYLILFANFNNIGRLSRGKCKLDRVIKSVLNNDMEIIINALRSSDYSHLADTAETIRTLYQLRAELDYELEKKIAEIC